MRKEDLAVRSEGMVYDEVVEIIVLEINIISIVSNTYPNIHKNSKATYMRNNQPPSNQHQIIYTDSRPLSITVRLLSNP